MFVEGWSRYVPSDGAESGLEWAREKEEHKANGGGEGRAAMVLLAGGPKETDNKSSLKLHHLSC